LGANDWQLRPGDQFFVADLNGDQHDEIVVVSADGTWIGILQGSGND